MKEHVIRIEQPSYSVIPEVQGCLLFVNWEEKVFYGLYLTNNLTEPLIWDINQWPYNQPVFFVLGENLSCSFRCKIIRDEFVFVLKSEQKDFSFLIGGGSSLIKEELSKTIQTLKSWDLSK